MTLRYHYFLHAILAFNIYLAFTPSETLANAEKGFEFYANHEFDQALGACKSGKDNFSKMIAALAYAERFRLYKNSEDKIQKNAYLNILKETITLKDIAEIERLITVTGNPFGLKEAEKLLKKAFDNLRTPEEVLIATNFLSANRAHSHNKDALTAISKFLKRIRSYVKKGGTMPSSERELFTNKQVIAPLVSLLNVKENRGQAEKCLVLIEEPVLPYLEEQSITKGISDTIVAVRKAMSKRLKKYPNSSWYSALGS